MRRYYLPGYWLLLALLLAGCSTAAPPEEGAEPPVPGAEPPATVEVTPEDTDGQNGDGQEAIAAAAKNHLSAETGISEEAMTVVSVEKQEWSNSALGCPQPDQFYMEVITPGYLVTIGAQGESFNVHTNADGSTLIVCENPEVTPAGEEGSTEQDGSSPIAERAKTHLATETGIPEDAITVMDSSKETWGNTSLGCPKPGTTYAAVTTPGYRFVMEAEGETFSVHTNNDGSAIVVCESGEAESSSEGGTMEGNDTGINLSGSAGVAAKAAISTLADETGLSPDELTIVEHEAVDWSDSSLGCPQPDQMYMQVITPGYRFVIEGGNERFNVHTNQDGSAAVVCDQS